MQKLPIGIQSFESIRQNGYLYIDKTEYIWNLLDNGKAYFLSRPRRFGKSLLLSTMQAYFLGKRELFRGLAIEAHESLKEKAEQWIPCPVFYFAFSGGAYQSEDGLAIKLQYTLDKIEKTYGIARADGLDLPTRFQHCIEEANRLTGQPAVVLVDEYDKPLLENFAINETLEEKNREMFKSFFSVLKDEDQYLKFVFISGVTKFSKISVFSDLNQLRDISLLPRYAAICGITENELRDFLTEEVEAMAEEQGKSSEETLEELAAMYDGYHFSKSGKGVYNPFSLFSALTDQDFNQYWYQTGTPTFLVRKLQQSGRPVWEFTEGVTATEARINDYRADNGDLVPLFYQSGYLSITGYDSKFRTYTLEFPNREVKYGFLQSLIPNASPSYKAPQGSFSADKMVEYLSAGNLQPFLQMLRAILASIPDHEGKIPEDEQQWRNIVYAIFTVLGQYVRTEVHSSGGRSDCEVENDRFIYIFEFKEDKSAAEALQQIFDNGYARPYSASEKQIVCVGINFSSKIKTIDEWKIERKDKKDESVTG